MANDAPIRFRPPPRPPAAHAPDVAAVCRAVRRAAATVAVGEVREFAAYEAAEFRRRIERQDFDSFRARPLSPAWVARKAAAHRDVRVMIATGTYKDRVRVFVRRDGRDAVVYVGFGADDRGVNIDGSRSHLRLHQIARIHEYGSAAGNVPARPHWGPHLADMRGRADPVRARIAARLLAAGRGAVTR